MSCSCTCTQIVLTDSNSHKNTISKKNFELGAREPNDEDDNEIEKPHTIR